MKQVSKGSVEAVNYHDALVNLAAEVVMAYSVPAELRARAMKLLAEMGELNPSKRESGK